MINVAVLRAALAEVFQVEAELQPQAGHEFPDWLLLSQSLAGVIRQRGWQLVAVSGPQGSGKSSLARVLVHELESQGVAAAAVSLDDFYLTRRQRQQLAARVHPLLATRGVPGTHDTRWLQRVMAAAGQTARVPVFDKGADDRDGGRQLAAGVLIVEGWCLGVTAQPRALLAEPVNRLEREEDGDARWRTWVNNQISTRYEPLWPLVDFWIYLRVPDFQQVYAWRRRQEQQLAPAARMSDAGLQRFVAHYERLARWMGRSPPLQPSACALLDEAHRVSDVTLLA